MKQIQLNVIFSTAIFWLIVDPYKNEKQCQLPHRQLPKTYGSNLQGDFCPHPNNVDPNKNVTTMNNKSSFWRKPSSNKIRRNIRGHGVVKKPISLFEVPVQQFYLYIVCDSPLRYRKMTVINLTVNSLSMNLFPY